MDGKGTLYQFAPVAQSRTNRHKIIYELAIRQQPKQSRMCNIKETGIIRRADRRPVDPPPVLQLTVVDPGAPGFEKSFLHNPFYFAYASILVAESGQELYYMPDGRTHVTNGSVVSSLYLRKDVNNADGGFFVFPALSIRLEGRFRLKFSLFEIVGKDVFYCTSVVSDPFTVYSAKNFPGMDESTFLSRSFAEQGLKIRFRKELLLWRRRGKRASKDEDAEETDDDSRRQRHANVNCDRNSVTESASGASQRSAKRIASGCAEGDDRHVGVRGSCGGGAQRDTQPGGFILPPPAYAYGHYGYGSRYPAGACGDGVPRLAPGSAPHERVPASPAAMLCAGGACPCSYGAPHTSGLMMEPTLFGRHRTQMPLVGQSEVLPAQAALPVHPLHRPEDSWQYLPYEFGRADSAARTANPVSWAGASPLFHGYHAHRAGATGLEGAPGLEGEPGLEEAAAPHGGSGRYHHRHYYLHQESRGKDFADADDGLTGAQADGVASGRRKGPAPGDGDLADRANGRLDGQAQQQQHARRAASSPSSSPFGASESSRSAASLRAGRHAGPVAANGGGYVSLAGCPSASPPSTYGAETPAGAGPPGGLFFSPGSARPGGRRRHSPEAARGSSTPVPAVLRTGGGGGPAAPSAGDWAATPRAVPPCAPGKWAAAAAGMSDFVPGKPREFAETPPRLA